MRQDKTDRLLESLDALPGFAVPDELAQRLKVVASRECVRRRRHVSLESFLAYLRSEAWLMMNNLIRPFAVPVAGGLASALVMLSMFVHAYEIPRTPSVDVPTGLSTEASLLWSIPIAMTAYPGDMVIDVDVDEQGKISGYSIPGVQAWAHDKQTVRRVEHFLVVTQFTPATFFGRPASGKARITLRRSDVDVRG